MQEWIERLLTEDYKKIFEHAGDLGVKALAGDTPRDTGRTADGWAYVVEDRDYGSSITWYNRNDDSGFNVAIGIQYGHGTGTGGYIGGQDYINPAMAPVFDTIIEELVREVSK